MMKTTRARARGCSAWWMGTFTMVCAGMLGALQLCCVLGTALLCSAAQALATSATSRSGDSAFEHRNALNDLR